MGIIALGINHKTAPVAVREKVSFDPAIMPDVLKHVLETLLPVTEVSILSTCNRTEIYCCYADQQESPVFAGTFPGQSETKEIQDTKTLSDQSTTKDAAKETAKALLAWLSHHHSMDEQVLQDSSYIHHDSDAVQHMMRVASGLDSLVLGEPQILGQFKSAFAVSQQAGTAGSNLGRLFRQTFSVAKEVRDRKSVV